MLDAYKFTQQNGIVKESDYPHTYMSKKNKCENTEGK